MNALKKGAICARSVSELQDLITSTFMSQEKLFTLKEIYDSVITTLSEESPFKKVRAKKVEEICEHTLLMLKVSDALRYRKEENKFYITISFPSMW